MVVCCFVCCNTLSEFGLHLQSRIYMRQFGVAHEIFEIFDQKLEYDCLRGAAHDLGFEKEGNFQLAVLNLNLI